MCHQTKWDDVYSSINEIDDILSHSCEYVLPYNLVVDIEKIKGIVSCLKSNLFPFIEKKKINRIKVYNAVLKNRSTAEGKKRQAEINMKCRLKKKLEFAETKRKETEL